LLAKVELLRTLAPLTGGIVPAELGDTMVGGVLELIPERRLG
jgi:hypothetical protein